MTTAGTNNAHIPTNKGTPVIRTALATLATLAALSGAALPAAQALPSDTTGTPGGGQTASPDGSTETKNDNRYQSSIEAALLRGAQQQCDQWYETYKNAAQHARNAEDRGDQEGATYWNNLAYQYLSKWKDQCNVAW